MSVDPGDELDRRSWVRSASGGDFPLQALPYGIFSSGAGARRVGVAIGDRILDLAALARAGLMNDACPGASSVFAAGSLNPFMACGPAVWRGVRRRIGDLLTEGHPLAEHHRATVEAAVVEQSSCRLYLPLEVADYVDFYSSLEHATNMGRMFRSEGEPLLPNWRHLPVGYHGRAGTVVVSGTPVLRPNGQRRGPGGSVEMGPSERLDIELEVGFVVGRGSEHGTPVPAEKVGEHLFGCVLVNDWSARDIQSFEYQPLGPFLGKSFATSISAWVLPLDALAAARVFGPPQDPVPLPYLRTDDPWGFDLALEVWFRPAGRDVEERLVRTGFAGMYWTIAQQVAHLTVNGASLRVGDLLASGTVSGPGYGESGSLIELTRDGSLPLTLASGLSRRFLENGDEVVLRGWADLAGTRVSLGEVRGTVHPPVAIPATGDSS
ncbi:MAG: fumarylacetoacetase [Acidimicrobiia bacterium]